MKKNNIGLTEEDVSTLLYDTSIYDADDNEIWIRTSNRILGVDHEKNSSEHSVTIQNVATGKKYKAVLGQSQWWKQSEENFKVEWEEVIPRKKK